MKRTLSLLLCALLLVSALAGCGGKSEQEKLIGIWKYALDAKELLASGGETEGLEELESLGADYSKLNVPILFTFTEDECTVEITEADARQFVENMTSILADAFETYFSKELNLSGKELDDTIREYVGMPIEDFAKAAVEDLDASDIVMKDTKAYTYQDGKILFEGGDTAWTVSFVSDTELSITDIASGESSGDINENLASLLPLTLIKQ